MKNRNLNHSDDWGTPSYIYDPLNERFKFDFDPCPLQSEVDNLVTEWGERNFVNPPYSRKLKEAFVKKGIQEAKKGKLCVFLIPVSTSTKLFHDYILPNITQPIEFIKGRIKFIGYNSKGEFVSDKSPMHDSMIVIFGNEKANDQEKDSKAEDQGVG